MSYCRMTEADLYLFEADWGIVCCRCWLYGGWQTFKSTDAALAHIAEHRAAGHYVPEHVDAELEQDRAEFTERMTAED